MQPSQLLFDLLKHFEGLILSAYSDSAGIPTIGYGTTHYPDGSAVAIGDTCTETEAQVYLMAHLRGNIDHLNATTPDGITQGNFDSLLDFEYNVGQGAWDSSSLRTAISETPTEFDAITADFVKWDKAHVNGQLVEMTGLLRRRKCEAYLYQNGVNHSTFFE